MILIPTSSEEKAAHGPDQRRQRLCRALAKPWPATVLARTLGLAIAAFALTTLVWSFALEGAPAPAPEYALGSAPLWRLERAVAATALVALLGSFIAQLVAGRLPRSIGREGVEWSPPPAERKAVDR